MSRAPDGLAHMKVVLPQVPCWAVYLHSADKYHRVHPVWSKNSCGLALGVFQQPAQLFTAWLCYTGHGLPQVPRLNSIEVVYL